MTFLFANPSHLWLEISSNSQSWQHQHFSSPSNCWRAYLNQLCLDAFLAYLRDEREQMPEYLPNSADLNNIWEFVNGAVITLGQKRWVLIPTEAIDDDELRVPQEWLDIPSWVADYYLAVQVNPDEGWVRIWGYTTHQQLKTHGRYDNHDRTYCLDGEDLFKDINTLWLSQEFCLDEPTRSVINSLPSLAETQAKNLIQRLGDRNVMFPRLAVPFPLWGKLLENDTWREQLYQQRQGSVNRRINLSRWLENLFETQWQTPQALNLAFNAARNTTENTIQRVKVLELSDRPVILLVEIDRQADDIGVSVSLYPEPNNRYLPSEIQLILLSESNETLRATQTRSEDNYIRLPRFRCSLGFSFRLQVVLDEQVITEDFVV